MEIQGHANLNYVESQLYYFIITSNNYIKRIPFPIDQEILAQSRLAFPNITPWDLLHFTQLKTNWKFTASSIVQVAFKRIPFPTDKKVWVLSRTTSLMTNLLQFIAVSFLFQATELHFLGLPNRYKLNIHQ